MVGVQIDTLYANALSCVVCTELCVCLLWLRHVGMCCMWLCAVSLTLGGLRTSGGASASATGTNTSHSFVSCSLPVVTLIGRTNSASVSYSERTSSSTGTTCTAAFYTTVSEPKYTHKTRLHS